MEEGGISEWFKKEGDFVEEGEPLLAIETDKATMEYNSPEEGFLLKILVPAGGTAALKTAIAVTGEKGEAPDYEQLLQAGPAPADPRGLDNARLKPAPEGVLPSSVSRSGPGSVGGRLRASPLAKKLAAGRNLDLQKIQGSGPLGRIIQRDVEAFVPAPVADGGIVGHDEVIPHPMMRKTIAKRLTAGKNDAPHFYLTASADMGAILSWRSDLNGEAGVKEGRLPKVSVNDLLIQAAARALRQHPELNASWGEEEITRYGRVDVCMAVALEGGLLTPVLRHADRLAAREIAEQTKSLAARAREGSLSIDEYTGGTFTISNLGMTKVEHFTAIINPPQACILAVGAVRAVPWVDDSGQIVVRRRMQMTLSCDHRLVDGMMGARFLETLILYLENPLRMIS